jgi:hypothetical protein
MMSFSHHQPYHRSVAGNKGQRFGRRAISSVCGGASVLLYSRHPRTQQVSLFLGQDFYDKKQWSDFGGGAKNCEKDYMCATRELQEETHGVVPCDREDVWRAPKVVFRFPHATRKHMLMHYSTFLVEVPHGGAQAKEFDSARADLSPEEQELVHRAEKSRTAFVPVADLPTTALRGFFKTRLRYILPLLKPGRRPPQGRQIVQLVRTFKPRSRRRKKGWTWSPTHSPPSTGPKQLPPLSPPMMASSPPSPSLSPSMEPEPSQPPCCALDETTAMPPSILPPLAPSVC